MIGQWLSRRPTEPADVRVRPLMVDDVSRLDLGWRSMFSPPELREHIERYPNRCFWVPATREYVVGGYWRHRREIGSVIELGARGEQRRPLTEALLAACAAERCPLVIFNDTSELRQNRWYGEIGFELIQTIVVYELALPPPSWPPGPPQLRFEVVTEPTDELLAVDHDAFPFLWWNCQAEFENYLDQGGVQIVVGRDATGRTVSYAGITLYQGWGHLDRLAVSRQVQGHGYGRETLAYVLQLIQASGARRTGLSTQEDNERSQVLYERFGFRRTYRTDYRIYGHWLVDEPAARRWVIGQA